MATKQKTYTVPIDKELCREFLLIPIPEIKEDHIREIRKIFNVVVRNYYADMKYDEEELFLEMMTKTLEGREKYNSQYCAYNYIYTGMRFSIGNERVSRKKVIITDELPAEKEVVTWERKDDEDELLEILSGFYEVVELAPRQVFNLLFADSEIAPQTAENLTSFVTKLSKDLIDKTSPTVQVIDVEGKKVRRIVLESHKLYVVNDLWEGLRPDRLFRYKKFNVPCITEARLCAGCFDKKSKGRFVKKLILS
jgi:hypothetical protein